MIGEQELLEEQRAYYRPRAPEYDEGTDFYWRKYVVGSSGDLILAPL